MVWMRDCLKLAEAYHTRQKGYLWIATHGGAARFDGHNFLKNLLLLKSETNNEEHCIRRSFWKHLDRHECGYFCLQRVRDRTSFYHFNDKNGFNSKRAYVFLERDGKMLIGFDKEFMLFRIEVSMKIRLAMIH